jgi:peptidoglycan/LPS O-acetylase OafA/YrhL
MSAIKYPAYRAGVDDVRAAAVLSVLIFHALPLTLLGGFIGVDIFFVVSGYLIPFILLKSMSAGQFSFAEFSGRRVQRVFTTLAVVFAASLLADRFV